MINPKDAVIYPTSQYILRFDGCSKGNPGLSGAGAVIYDNNNEMWGKSLFVGNKHNNNQDEYTGLIIGLEEAVNSGIKHLTVEGDSLLVIKQMNNEYKVKSNNLIDLHNKAKELSNKFENITFSHIYRKNNKRADELSNLAI